MQFLLIHTLKNSVVYYFTMILIQIMKYLNAAQSSRNSDLWENRSTAHLSQSVKHEPFPLPDTSTN